MSGYSQRKYDDRNIQNESYAPNKSVCFFLEDINEITDGHGVNADIQYTRNV